MPIYIPNLIVLAFRLRDSLACAVERHEWLFMLLCAGLSWLTLELTTPLGPVWGNSLTDYPLEFTLAWGTLLVLGLILATAAITKDRRYTKEAWLVSLTMYCFILVFTAGFEYAATCGIFLAMASTVVYLAVTNVIGIGFYGATE